MRPDSLLRLWRYINHLLTYLLTRGRIGNVKQMSFEPRPEDSYGRCGSDKIKIGQTVPDVSSDNGKSSVTDGRQSGAADNQ